MTKQESQMEDLKKALARLGEAIELPSTAIHQDATIQRFEFTFELAWKVMKSIINEEGIDVASPKSTIREAADLHLIEDPKLWMEFLNARNLSAHTYREDIAQLVYLKAKEFVPAVEKLIVEIDTREK